MLRVMALSYKSKSLATTLTSKNLNFKSYWGGEWVSTWTIDLNAGGTVAGHIRVHNHYYE